MANLKGGVFLSNIETKDAEEITNYIFRSSITLPDGRKIYAVNYGKRAFRIPVEL
jgi:hypothetical protein